ncbi:MAG: AsmA-like C-terminal region-containing protein [Bacteroidales bacterium]|nr:AsmA-like C-terminal region-containing protein [Bacteroidales bacterium]
MNRARKILKYILAAGSSLVIILFLVSIIFEAKISRIFISELNKNLSAPVSTGDLNFSLLRRFPRASIELENILLKSPRIDSDETVNVFPDTLLFAGEIIFTLRIAPLINKNYVVDRIDIDRGIINISKASSGRMNTDIYEKSAPADSSTMKLNINNININNSSFTYSVQETGFLIGGLINSSANKVLMEEGLTELKSKSSTVISTLKTGRTFELNDPYPVKFTAGLVFSEDSINIVPAEINIDGVGVKGACRIGKSGKELSIVLETGKANIKKIAGIVLPRSRDHLDQYGIDGVLTSALSLRGSYVKSLPLGLRVKLELEKGLVNIPSPGIIIDDISSSARLSMDFRNGNNNFEIYSNRINASLDNTDFFGSFHLRNLKNPYIDLIISGLFPSEQLAGLLNEGEITSSEGRVRMNARLSGPIPSKTDATSLNFPGLKRTINLGLNSVNLGLPALEGEIDNIHGNIMIADNVWIDDLSMSYNGQNIALNGMIRGFDKWLQGENPNLEITAGIWSEKINLASFRDKFTGGGSKEGRRETKTRLNLNILCDSIIIGNFRASLFDGNLSYVPGLTDITSFSMNALNGFLSGNAVIADLGETGYAVRGWFDIENVDIGKTFSTFNNFRQHHLKSENLEGLITGTISVSASTNRQFKINMNDLVLNGEYLIVDGKLVNFEPAYKLSRFIEIDELAEIEFSRLENELIINNEVITIPRMDVSSSAFNISLEGTHGFDGKYEYRLKVLLSELLSKKKNFKVSEFGVVEDDGLGRTSLYLSISGDKYGSKLSHDTEALRTGLKEDMQKEKQTIKSILNEEYGWYTGDTRPADEADKTRRFRVVWEETDSIRTVTADTSEKKLPLLRLFKRKNINK